MNVILYSYLKLIFSHHINLLMFGLTSKTEARLGESRSIDQHRRLVEIDKKYALMSSTTQRQVTSQLECIPWLMQRNSIILSGRRREKRWRREKLKILRIFTKKREIIEWVELALKFPCLTKTGRWAWRKNRWGRKDSLIALTEWGKGTSMKMKRKLKKCLNFRRS